MVYMMSFLPKIFGAKYFIVILQNVFSICAANLIFYFFTKPDGKVIHLLLFIQSVLFVN